MVISFSQSIEMNLIVTERLHVSGRGTQVYCNVFAGVELSRMLGYSVHTCSIELNGSDRE